MLKNLLPYWRSHLWPSPAALALLSAAGALAGAGLVCAALYGLSEAKSFAEGMGRFAFIFGFLAMPGTAAILLGAAWREKRPLPRGLVIGVAAVAVAVGGLAMGLGIGLSSDVESPFVVGVANFIFCFTPPLIALLGLIVGADTAA